MDTILDILKGVVNSINNGAWRIAAAGVILIAVQACKLYLPKVKGVWAWVVACGLGMLWGLGTGLGQATVTFGVIMSQMLNGFMVGLMSSGLFEGAKKAAAATPTHVLNVEEDAKKEEGPDSEKK